MAMRKLKGRRGWNESSFARSSFQQPPGTDAGNSDSVVLIHGSTTAARSALSRQAAAAPFLRVKCCDAIRPQHATPVCVVGVGETALYSESEST